MSWLELSVLGLALGVAACGDAPACEDYQGKELGSEHYSGTATLSSAGDSTGQRLRVTLRGLPELWDSTSPIHLAILTTTIREQYTEGQPGADGRTQMPRILTSFGSDPPTELAGGPPYFPTAAPTVLGNALFDCYADPNGPCCKYGSTECSVAATLFVTRVEGEPFAPVTVDYDATAAVNVGQCPIPSSPVLELTPESEP